MFICCFVVFMVGIILIVVILGLVVFGFVGIVSVSLIDEVFFVQLQVDGIILLSVVCVIKDVYVVCDVFDEGYLVKVVIKVVVKVIGLSVKGVKMFVVDVVLVYCLQYVILS